MKHLSLGFAALLFASVNVFGKTVDYDLTISETKVEFTGRSRTALTINGGIPGPTLRFREGDFARIMVHNGLPHEETSLHWHGLLVPNEMDGVPYLR
jgi:FtsP/CotA-like multicopper oxidase with cupredoxin domain